MCTRQIIKRGDVVTADWLETLRPDSRSQRGKNGELGVTLRGPVSVAHTPPSGSDHTSVL